MRARCTREQLCCDGTNGEQVSGRRHFFARQNLRRNVRNRLRISTHSRLKILRVHRSDDRAIGQNHTLTGDHDVLWAKRSVRCGRVQRRDRSDDPKEQSKRLFVRHWRAGVGSGVEHFTQRNTIHNGIRHEQQKIREPNLNVHRASGDHAALKHLKLRPKLLAVIESGHQLRRQDLHKQLGASYPIASQIRGPKRTKPQNTTKLEASVKKIALG